MNGSGRESVHDTNLRSVGCAEPLSGGAHNSLRVPRPDPPLLPSIIFPLGQAQGALHRLENFGIFRHFLMRHARKLLMSLV